MTARRRRLVTIAATVLAVVAGLTVSLTRQQQAQALTGSQFNAGNIISDAQFYNSKTMSASDVQAFLALKYTGCANGYVCLRDYTTKTTSEPAESGLCNAYTGKASETAAQIIANVASACGVNPQVLLVLLQKESGLLTTTTPDYQTAAGFGCPDSTGCNSKYYGFFNQVYLAARQFKLYRLYPTNYNYVAGRSNYILYNPNTKCGGTNVVIQNQATAGLYDYTPYQPNAAALANLTGTGDKCSAYGNRNFWYFFNTWFPGSSDPGPTGGMLLSKPNGTLWYYANTGTADSPYEYPPVQVGVSGWQKLSHLAAGDVDGDGLADVVATRSDGSLWVYHNSGDGLPLTKRTEIGLSGWGAFSEIMLGDVDGDGRADLLALRPSGQLLLYRNTGSVTRPFSPHTVVGTGWQTYSTLMLGDVDNDGLADVVAVKQDGSLWLYHNGGNAASPFGSGVLIGTRGWRAFDKITLTDVDADGYADLVASRPDGTLWLYRNVPGRAYPYGTATQIGASGWQAFGAMVATSVPVPHPPPAASDLLATTAAGTLWEYPNQTGRPYSGFAQVGTGWQVYSRLLLGDVNHDGRADLIAVRPNGTLWLYPDSGSATNPYPGGDRIEIGTSGWQNLVQLVAADVNGDGRVDLVATRSDGTLWLYPNSGNAKNPFPHRQEIGQSGWGKYDRIVAGDVNGDGKDDLIATRSDGSLVRYLSTGSTAKPYSAVQSTALSGWQSYAALTAADVDGDGRADLVAAKPSGTLWLDRDGGTDRFPRTVSIGTSGWQGYNTILAGDVVGDGPADLITRTPGGVLRLYRNTGGLAELFGSAQQVGVSGWQKLGPLMTGDVDHDARPDLVGVRTGGTLWLYPASSNAAKPFDTAQRTQIGASGWQNYDMIVAGDVDGDGYADLIARKPDGTLWLYLNKRNATQPYGTDQIQIGSGWQQYDELLAADVTGDGLVDLIARKPDGTLWLYRDTRDPNRPFPSAVKIGSGFQAYDKLAAGDVDRDGRADLLAAKPDGSLWLYRNSGSPTNPYPSKVEVLTSGLTTYDRIML